MAPTTPDRPPAEPDAQFTKELDNPSPSNRHISQFQEGAHNKRQKKITKPAATVGLGRPGTAPSKYATENLTKRLREAQILVERNNMVYGKLATLLDSFIDDFAEPHLQKERQMAKVIVNNCLQYLNTAVYASTNEDMVAPIRLQSSASITTDSEEENGGVAVERASRIPQKPIVPRSWAQVAQTTKSPFSMVRLIGIAMRKVPERVFSGYV
ncbi:hypothetical protein PG999_004580 [Apiospora kogelbergensis]|uniref:Uncharacterized protein n=1 Tax=Apiospora kogelbergensis TaxID=1337665 RepID=A0AAW0QZN1_9PEZI